MDFAYLSGGRLHLKVGDAPVRQVDSKFGESLRQRAVEIRNRNAWKTQGTGAQFMGRGGGLVPRSDPGAMPIAISGIARSHADDQFFYALRTPEISGLFAVRGQGTDEQRLFHTSDFQVEQICGAREHDRLAFVLTHGWTSNLAVMRADGSDMSEVTQGDSLDQAPSWIPGTDQELLFQTAGIARNEQGYSQGHSPYSLQKIDLRTGEITPVLEDPQHDLLAPRADSAGNLYFIRRPYKSNDKPPAWKLALYALWGLIKLPYTLVRALFHFLNFFSAKYSGQTLVDAGGAQKREADMERMMIWGNLVDAGKTNPNGDEAPDLVPSSWELVRRDKEGATQLLAKGVLAYDLQPDGAVLYSNGSAVTRLAPDGTTKRLYRDRLIQQVVVLS